MTHPLSANSSAAGTSAPHPRILIVDDHGDLRKLVRMTLDMGKFELHEADCADRALDLLPVVRPDLIILDVMMPGRFDGLDLCRAVRDGRRQSTRVILLSAKGQKDDVAAGLSSGADAYLVKPFSPLQLIETVQATLKAA